MTELTDEQLDELEALHAAATPGPYSVETGGDYDDYASGPYVTGIKPVAAYIEEIFLADAEYLALAANLAPALVAEVRKIRAENDALRLDARLKKIGLRGE